jgi:N-acetylglutamate synthase-like GNAT family acetyltransferase
VIATTLKANALGDLTAELQAACLPTSDIGEPGRRFFRFDDPEGIIGYGGIEGVVAERLLRSLVVSSERRGRGSGEAVLAALEQLAADDGVTHLYLLTTTAETFFRRHGYEAAERAAAPVAIAMSAEFRSLCPASAAFLHKWIA